MKENQIVGIPTETVYGIGVNPNSQEAVDNLFKIKKRDDDKPVSLLVHSFAELRKLNIKTEIPEVVDLYWPGPLTVVVEVEEAFPPGVGTNNPNSVGIRVPENELALELLKQTGPLAVTSANISGNREANNHIEAENIFGRFRFSLFGRLCNSRGWFNSCRPENRGRKNFKARSIKVATKLLLRYEYGY